MSNIIYYNDSKTGYVYSLDYCKGFLSPVHSNQAIMNAVKHDFTFNLTSFLTENNFAEANTSYAVANSLFCIMSDFNRHYHTPYHVLYILLLASKMKIKLKVWESLAIWFHDAIYYPIATYSYNESQSVSFMRAMLPDGLRLNDNGDLNQADRAIMATADHLQDIVPLEFCSVLDLDISILGAESSVFVDASKCTREEFCNYVNPRRFKKGRKKFFETILAKREIFRTEKMRELFEDRARKNIQLALKGL